MYYLGGWSYTALELTAGAGRKFVVGRLEREGRCWTRDYLQVKLKVPQSVRPLGILASQNLPGDLLTHRGVSSLG